MQITFLLFGRESLRSFSIMLWNSCAGTVTEDGHTTAALPLSGTGGAVLTVRPSWIDAARISQPPQLVEDAKAVWRILPVFACYPMFWSVFDQQFSSWVFLAKKTALMGIQPEQLGVLNSL